MVLQTHSRFPERSECGFTMVEMVVALGVVGILAAILTPMVAGMIDDARVTRAARETQTIAKAVQNFRRNTGKWPIFVSGVSITTSSAIYDVELGPGNDPSPPGST